MSVDAPEYPATPTLVNARTGVRRQVGFFGTDTERVFGCTYLPREGLSAGVVICSPVAAELEKNYRRETLLAEALAARGLAVQRFHYRGVGHSDGDAAALTFESMVDDALQAAAHLSERAQVDRLAFVGTRLGGLTAAAAVAGVGGPLVLWEPVIDGRRYFREVFRVVAMRAVRKGERSPADGALGELRRQGSIDVLGHTIGFPLYESTVGRSLDESLGTRPRDVLLVQLSRDASVRSEHRDVANRLGVAGLAVEIRVIDEAEPWWFGEHRRGRRALTTVTSEWLRERLAPRTH